MYAIFKALHIIGMVAWFAGLFYLFRLFVYQVENKEHEHTIKTLQTMTRKLYYYITWPAMVFTWAFGLLTLAHVPVLMQTTWFQAKLFLLVLLVVYHLFIGHTHKAFLKGNFYLSSKQCRMLNELPTLILVVIVLLAVLKPF